MPFICPVCGYPELRKPPEDFLICPSCGTEFGYHDSARSHAQIRQQWVDSGLRWHSTVIPHPVGWNGWIQLIDANYFDVVPKYVTHAIITATVPAEGPPIDFSREPWVKLTAA